MAAPVAPDDPDLVSTWTRLRQQAVSAERIRAQLTAGRWQRQGLAIVLHNGPPTRDQSWEIARVHGGPSALLTAFTAAESYGLRGWQRDAVHLLVPQGARCSSRSPVPIHLHRCRDWSSVAARSRVHGCPDALVLAASAISSPRAAAAILAAGVQQRLVRPADLVAALGVRTRARHRTVLLAALKDIDQGAEALSEIDFVRLCRRYGIPPPQQQAVRREPSGRRRYLDAVWRRADGRLVVVEVDGALHLDARRWWDDQDRQNEIALDGALVLRFPSVVVRTRPGFVARQLGRALAPVTWV